MTARDHKANARWERFVTPRSDGLPNLRVLAWFPALLLVLLFTATIAGVSASSTGTWGFRFEAPDSDPRLVAGVPRSIRSDEWLVQGSWILSQEKQGFPKTNRVFPGGMDATVMNDAPTWDWSTAFRPHLWGTLVFGVDHGMAFRWWIQAVAIMVAVYAFCVSLLPRRPLLGAALAIAVVYQPFAQWWWLPALTTAVTFCFLAMTAAWWGLKAKTRAARIVPAAIAGYAGITMGMSIYVPFMLACIYPAAGFIIGAAVFAWRAESMPLRDVARRLAPLALAGVGVGAVMIAWILTRRDTVDALLNTAYPGQRLTATGLGGEAQWVTLFSFPFQRALTVNQWAGLGTNQSTSSTSIMLSLFLLPALLWLVYDQWRTSKVVDWVIIGVTAAQAFVLAFMFVPGWDVVAHLFLADRSMALRMRITFLVLLAVSVVLLVQRLDARQRRAPWTLTAASGLIVALSGIGVLRWLEDLDSPVVPSTYALVLIGASVLIVVLFVRRYVAIAAALLVASTLVVSAGIHPLYRGMFDPARDTEAGRIVTKIHQQDPDAAWVGVGNWISMGTLFSAAVPAYSGVQTYPSMTMWNRIDPRHEREFNWNRLGHIHWLAGTGDPLPRQPENGAIDVIDVTFDSCAPFAQKYVTYVLADGPPLDQPCLREIKRFQQAVTESQIYRVVPKA